MAKKHVVKQGECLSTIAEKYGFLDWRMVYEHPANSALRKQRPNPNIVFPGDVVNIPKPPETEGLTVKVATGNTEQIVVDRDPTLLRLKVLDHVKGDGCQAKYLLEVEGLPEPKKGEIDKTGELEVAIPPWARTGRLTLLSKSTGEVMRVLDLDIGGLDPLTSPSGVRERLRRLGFDPGPDPEYTEESEGDELGPQTQAALRSFQVHFELKETGLLDDDTRAKLAEVAGA